MSHNNKLACSNKCHICNAIYSRANEYVTDEKCPMLRIIITQMPQLFWYKF